MFCRGRSSHIRKNSPDAKDSRSICILTKNNIGFGDINCLPSPGTIFFQTSFNNTRFARSSRSEDNQIISKK
jgi:hypothetical protein